MTIVTYATVDEYRADTGDAASSDERIQSKLEQQSAKLRALVGISSDRVLSDDQVVMARDLVVDATRKALVPPSFDGAGDVTGASEASFSANGFQSSVRFSNPSGSAYFDRSTLSALRRSLGSSQRIGIIAPFYGGV